MDNTPIHILLADDDEADRLLFTEAFGELKIKSILHTVNNGVQLMDYLHQTDNRLPHLLFLDLNMPRKNGLACLKEIRSDPRLKEITVAIYSTSDAKKDVEETFLQGANIYLHKPNNFNELRQSLEKAVLTYYQHQHQPHKNELFLLKL